MALDRYRGIVEDMLLEEIRLIAKELKGLRVLNVNSAKKGGGVAKILNRLVPLLRDVGIKADWKTIRGDPEFFRVTKKLHNLLHLKEGKTLDSKDITTYLRWTFINSKELDTSNYDLVIIHDPQPMGLIINKKEDQRWVWRCHIDLSTPDEGAWNFVEQFLNAYDCAIFHIPEFVKEGVKVRTFIIPPSIDPLDEKNRELKEEEVLKIVKGLGINLEKPTILQVSRFDKLKDPLGVIEGFKLLKEEIDCQLILAGSFAEDDPEGKEVLNTVLSKAKPLKDVHILNLPPDSDLTINALQRFATVVVQKSIREGFGLVVSEAMWKEKAVVGSNVGGIRRQIIDRRTGFLINSVEGMAYRVKQLLMDEELRREMGKNAKGWVCHRFLILRHLRDYLLLFNELL